MFSRASCSRRDSALSHASRVRNALMAPPSVARYICATSDTTGTIIVCTRILRSPSALVYNSAHCRYEVFVVGKTSSCAICTAYAWSAFAAGRANKSMERMKKWPLKDETRNPFEHRTLHTASHAVNRVRLCLSSFDNFLASRPTRKPG